MSLDCFVGAKILITGGAGFVGSNLCHTLLTKVQVSEIWIVDNLLSADIQNVPGDDRVNFVLGSIADDRLLARLPLDWDYVFHLACYHGNQSSIADPIADHDNNTLTSLKLFDWLRRCTTMKKLVYAAAGCAVAEKTFGIAHATSENDPVSLFQDSPYSISKLIGELYGNFYFMNYGLPFVKARFQNVYGPREILGAGRWRGTPHTVWRNVIPTFVWKALHGEALPLENGGNASRDFIFVEDIVRGLLACAMKGTPGENYNLASGIETSILDLAVMINELSGNLTPVAVKPARDWDHSGRRFGSTSKSKEKLDFEAKVSIREGLAKTIAWTKQERDHIARNLKAHQIFLPEVKQYE